MRRRWFLLALLGSLCLVTTGSPQSQLINGDRVIVGTLNLCVDSVGTDAYACSLSPAITTYIPGARYTFKAGTTNTGPATLALNGLVAKPIVKVTGGLATALIDNDIRAGQYVDVVYDSTADNFQMQSTSGNAAGGDVTDVGSCTGPACFTTGSPAANLTFNNATSGTVVLQTVTGALGSVTVSLPAATDTLIAKATTDVLTNKTYDTEATGNVFTSMSKIWLPAASCQNTTAQLLWDTPTSAFPVAACATSHGVADFATDSGSLSMHQTLLLPDDWTGVLDGKVMWFSTATTNDVVWQILTLCIADGEVDSLTFVNATTITDTAKGVTNQMNTTALTTIVTTGCAAGELMHVRIQRDPAHASDTFAAGTTARLYGLELTLRRSQ